MSVATRALLLALLPFTYFIVDSKASVSNAEGHSIPVGHMEPFGGHRNPDPVDEIEGFPSAKQFMENYVKTSIPLVFRGAAKQFPAFKLWTEKYLKENYADLEVRLEAKKEKQGFVPVGAAGLGRDTISSFIDNYHQTNRYIVSELPTPMWNDVSVLPSLSCGPFIKRFVEIDIWMSGGDTSSLIHKDAYNTINCVVNGTKEWKLIAYEHQDKIYQFEEEMEGVGGFSKINASSVDLLKYPLVSKAPWSFTTVQKGDCLFLPGSMWHQVQSHGDMNVAVAFLFARFDPVYDQNERRRIPAPLDFSDCKTPSGRQERFIPLNEVDVDLQYPGHGDMTMGVNDFESGLDSLTSCFRRKTGEFSLKLTSRAFKSAWQGGSRKQLKEKALVLRDLLRKWTGKKNVTFEDATNMPRQGMREILVYYHPEIPENTGKHEYIYIGEAEIHHVIHSLLTKHGVLNKQQFLQGYMKGCGGTKKFGEDVFARLQSSPEEMDNLSEDDVKARLRYATFKHKRSDAFETGFVLSADEEETFQTESDYAIDEESWSDVAKYESDETNNQEQESDAYEGKVLEVDEQTAPINAAKVEL